MKLPVDLQNGENVLHISHRHIVYLMLNLASALFGGLIPLIILLVLAGTASGAVRSILLVVSVVWAFGALIVIYFTWYRYENDIWVITNQRLIDSTKQNPFHHQVSSADLVNVEDMTVLREGVLPTLFKYGDLKCQTAGATGTFILKGIPTPQKVLDIVDSARDSARRQLGYRPGQMGMG